MRRLVVPLFAIPALACQFSLAAQGAPQAPLTLEGMQITAPSEQADGPVDGYRATRSASGRCGRDCGERPRSARRLRAIRYSSRRSSSVPCAR